MTLKKWQELDHAWPIGQGNLSFDVIRQDFILHAMGTVDGFEGDWGSEWRFRDQSGSQEKNKVEMIQKVTRTLIKRWWGLDQNNGKDDGEKRINPCTYSVELWSSSDDKIWEGKRMTPRIFGLRNWVMMRPFICRRRIQRGIKLIFCFGHFSLWYLLDSHIKCQVST